MLYDTWPGADVTRGWPHRGSTRPCRATLLSISRARVATPIGDPAPSTRDVTRRLGGYAVCVTPAAAQGSMS